MKNNPLKELTPEEKEELINNTTKTVEIIITNFKLPYTRELFEAILYAYTKGSIDALIFAKGKKLK